MLLSHIGIDNWKWIHNKNRKANKHSIPSKLDLRQEEANDFDTINKYDKTDLVRDENFIIRASAKRGTILAKENDQSDWPNFIKKCASIDKPCKAQTVCNFMENILPIFEN